MQSLRISLLLLALALCAPERLQAVSEQPTERDWAWAEENFPKVLSALMPLNEPDGISIGYRSYRDLHTDQFEDSFILNSIPGDQWLRAVVRIPDAVSLHDQMLALHRKHPALSLDELKKQIRLNEWRLSEDRCPAVRVQYSEYLALSVPAVAEEDSAGVVVITLHPRVHTIAANSSGGALEMQLTEPDHPFVKWARRTLDALQACITRESAKPQQR